MNPDFRYPVEADDWWNESRYRDFIAERARREQAEAEATYRDNLVASTARDILAA